MTMQSSDRAGRDDGKTQPPSGPCTRVLILTLYGGENELDECVAALQSQTYHNWDHRIFRHLPNVEAHRRLYQTVMEERESYGLFIKLDADMVLKDPTSLERIVAYFAASSDLDHAVFSVSDFMTQEDILGLHVFSPRVSWAKLDEALFVDPDPDIPGRRCDVWEDPAPVALHAPNPGDAQAFHFGVQRALKAFQPGRIAAHLFQSRLQWAVLQRLARHYRRSGDPRLARALLGAELVRRGRIGEQAADYKSAAFLQQCENVSALADNELPSLIGFWVSPRITQEAWRAVFVLPRCMLGKIVRFVAP